MPKRLNRQDLEHVCANLSQRSRREITACRWSDDVSDLADAVEAAETELAFSFHHDGKPAYVFGVVEIWPKRYTSFGFGTEYTPKVIRQATKFILRGIIPALKRLGAVRLDTRCLDDDQVNRWNEFLGGVKGPTLNNYGKRGEAFVPWTWEF